MIGAMVQRPAASSGLDALDERLVTLLLSDGRMTNRALAQEVGLTDSTVAARLRRMVGEGLISIGPQFDWRMAGYHSQAMVYVTVSGKAPRSVGAQVMTVPGVIATSVSFGSTDLVLFLLAPDDAELLRSLAEIGRVPGVVSVEVDHIVDVLMIKPYAARLPYTPTHADDLPNPQVSLTGLDREIISHLQVDGRMSSREIARHTGVSDVTVRTRLKRLEDGGLLRIGALVDPWRTGQIASVAYLGFAEVHNLDTLSKSLCEHPNITFCATSVGNHGVVATVAAQSHDRMTQLVTDSLWKLKGARRLHVWPSAELLGQRSDLVRLLP